MTASPIASEKMALPSSPTSRSVSWAHSVASDMETKPSGQWPENRETQELELTLIAETDEVDGLDDWEEYYEELPTEAVCCWIALGVLLFSLILVGVNALNWELCKVRWGYTSAINEKGLKVWTWDKKSLENAFGLTEVPGLFKTLPNGSKEAVYMWEKIRDDRIHYTFVHVPTFYIRYVLRYLVNGVGIGFPEAHILLLQIYVIVIAAGYRCISVGKPRHIYSIVTGLFFWSALGGFTCMKALTYAGILYFALRFKKPWMMLGMSMTCLLLCASEELISTSDFWNSTPKDNEATSPWTIWTQTVYVCSYTILIMGICIRVNTLSWDLITEQNRRYSQVEKKKAKILQEMSNNAVECISPLEYWGYMLCPTHAYCVCNSLYKHYRSFCDGSLFSKHGVSIHEFSWGLFGRDWGTFLICLVIFMIPTFISFIPGMTEHTVRFDVLQDPERWRKLTTEHIYPVRVFIVWLLCMLIRFRYHAFFRLASIACQASGIAFSGRDEEDNVTFHSCKNNNILNVELNTSMGGIVNNWNMTTNFWLKYYLYLRMTIKNKWSRMMLTRTVSALWHGILPGQIIFFVSTVGVDYSLSTLEFIMPTYESKMREGKTALAYLLWVIWYILIWAPLSTLCVFFFTMDITHSFRIMTSLYWWPYIFLAVLGIVLTSSQQIYLEIQNWREDERRREVAENFSADVSLEEAVTGKGNPLDSMTKMLASGSTPTKGRPTVMRKSRSRQRSQSVDMEGQPSRTASSPRRSRSVEVCAAMCEAVEPIESIAEAEEETGIAKIEIAAPKSSSNPPSAL